MTDCPRLLALYGSATPVCGIGTWLDLLATELPRYGWKVEVGVADGRQYFRAKEVLAAHPNWNARVINGESGTRLGRQLSLESILRDANPDVVLVTTLEDALIAALNLKFSGAGYRVVVANHGNNPNHVGRIIEASADIDLIATVNRASFDVLLRHVADSSRVVCIPNAVPPARTGSKKYNATLRVGYAGRLCEDKRTPDLMPFAERLFESTDNTELWIAGNGPLTSFCQGLAARWPGRCFYKGEFVRDGLYAEFYPQLDVLVSFSASEGWPMAIAEAMSHGVVPVVSEFAGIHAENVLRDNETALLFSVGDIDSAAHLVAELQKSPESLHDLSRAARFEIESQFTFERFGREWSQTLYDIMKRPLQNSGKARHRETTCWWPVVKERTRQMLGRSVPHQSPRSEWPTWTCQNATLLEKLKFELQPALVDATAASIGSLGMNEEGQP